MSTLYHDNCSFSWYPVDVENSVRVRDSRLKNCDKKRTGIQTLRPGASTRSRVLVLIGGKYKTVYGFRQYSVKKY